jgi:hypothetical protein
LWLNDYQKATITYLYFSYHADLEYGVFKNNQQIPTVGNDKAIPASSNTYSYGYGRGQSVSDFTGKDNMLNTYVFLNKNSIFKIMVKNKNVGILLATDI